MIWILLLYGFTVVSCYHTVVYEYHYIDLLMSWADARQYCRRHYTDLATIRNAEDLSRLNRPGWFTAVAWIGLFDDTASWKGVMGNNSNSWRWSATGTTSTSQYHKWVSGEPNHIEAIEKCVFMRSGAWLDGKCSRSFPFVCFTGSTEPGSKNYSLVLTSMSWEHARSHCRQHFTDLAMIEDESENTAVTSIISSYTVWIGLYRQPWRWTDGSASNFTNWYPGRPNNYARVQHCVHEKNNHEWNDFSCSNAAGFICHRAVKTKLSLMPMKLQSGADLSDPTVLSQLTKEIQEELLKRGLTDLKVKWKNIPTKQMTNEKKKENQSDQVTMTMT